MLQHHSIALGRVSFIDKISKYVAGVVLSSEAHRLWVTADELSLYWCSFTGAESLNLKHKIAGGPTCAVGHDLRGVGHDLLPVSCDSQTMSQVSHWK